MFVPKKSDGAVVDNQKEHYSFKFDNVLHNASQETVYEECARDAVLSFVQGYNASVMAYGQTGAGKTFTMVQLFVF